MLGFAAPGRSNGARWFGGKQLSTPRFFVPREAICHVSYVLSHLLPVRHFRSPSMTAHNDIDVTFSRKIESEFVALKPFVCSSALCLFQLFALGLGPSIEHEIKVSLDNKAHLSFCLTDLRPVFVHPDQRPRRRSSCPTSVLWGARRRSHRRSPTSRTRPRSP